MSNTTTVLKIFISLVFVVFASWLFAKSLESAKEVKAFGNLLVKYQGTKLTGPLFVVEDMMPGDCQERLVSVKNNGSISSRVYIRATSLTDQVSSAINLKIINDELLLRDYLLSNFFVESATGSGVLLSRLSPGQIEEVKIQMCLSKLAENNFAGRFVKFDLKFDEVIERYTLPEDCQGLKEKITKKIEGTSKNDHLRGTRESEYILGLDGNDRIDGGGGDDCIEAGRGNDHVEGGDGRDIILGGEGKDNLDGEDDEDRIIGAEGDDHINGGDDADWLSGGPGKDTVDGGRSKDRCDSGEKYKNCEKTN